MIKPPAVVDRRCDVLFRPSTWDSRSPDSQNSAAPVSAKNTPLAQKTRAQSSFQNTDSGGWRAVSTAGSQEKGLRERNVVFTN